MDTADLPFDLKIIKAVMFPHPREREPTGRDRCVGERCPCSVCLSSSDRGLCDGTGGIMLSQSRAYRRHGAEVPRESRPGRLSGRARRASVRDQTFSPDSLQYFLIKSF